jgi:hypothetical protein
MKIIESISVAVFLFAAGACSKKEADAQAAAGAGPTQVAGGCGPLRIVVDGVERKGLKGLAVTLKNGQYETEQVELYDSDAIDCAAILAPAMQLPDGTLALRAYYHPQAQGLGTESYTEMGVNGITLLAKAKAAGSETEICVPAGASFTPSTGTLQGKKVEVSGALAGTYCGVKDMTAR